MKTKFKTHDYEKFKSSLINIVVQRKKICVKYDGIGNMELSGTTQQVEIFSSGIGNIDCDNLFTKTAIVR